MSFVSFKPGGFGGNASAGNMRPRGVFDPSAWSADGFLGTGGFLDTMASQYVKRPIAGIRIKERSPASFMVLDANGKHIPLLASTGMPWNEEEGSTDWEWEGVMGGGFWDTLGNWGSGRKKVSKYYTDFSLVKVEENRAEKVQIAQTFGEDFLFMFGERPRMLSCVGVLVNSRDFEWRSRFWDNYDKYLRGTRLVEMNARVYLSWDDIMVEGYLISASALDIAQEPHAIQFSFVLLITNYINVGPVRGSIIEALADVFHGVKDVLGALKGFEGQGLLGSRQTEGLTSLGGHLVLGPHLEGRQIDTAAESLYPPGPAQEAAKNNARIERENRRQLEKAAKAAKPGMEQPPPKKKGLGPAPVKRMFGDPIGPKVNHNTRKLSKQDSCKGLFGPDHQNCAGMRKIDLPPKR